MQRSYVAEVAEVAAEQWGLVTTAQARAVGATSQVMARLARTGRIERLAHGVYRMVGAPHHRHEDLRAAWLALDPVLGPSERLDRAGLAVVSHRSAAVVLELGDVDADAYEFTVPDRKQTRRGDVVVHRGVVDHGDWTLVDGLPVTTPLRTVRDLAMARVDRGHLAAVVRDAVVRYEVPVTALAAVLAGYAQGYGAVRGDGTALVELMLDEVGVPASALDAVRHSPQRRQQLLADPSLPDMPPGRATAAPRRPEKAEAFDDVVDGSATGGADDG